MQKEIIATSNAPEAIGPYSQAVKAGGFVFLSGQIALDPKTMEIAAGGVVEQTEKVLQNMGAVLEAAGSSFADVLKVTVYLKDLGEFGTVNEIYGRYFQKNPPARACVEVPRLPKDVLVEMDAVALARS
jgi:2-iminobutanoate/2-iminopropanoate deaminase